MRFKILLSAVIMVILLEISIRLEPVWEVYYISEDGTPNPIAVDDSYESSEVFCVAIAEHLGTKFICKETTWWDRLKLRWQT